MARGKTISRGIAAALFALAGANHFWHAPVYVGIMPPYLPYPLALVYISGAAEIALGLLLLIERWTALAAWGLIALLIAVFPANVQMALHPAQFAWATPIVLWLRLPLQGVLIAWIYSFTGATGKIRPVSS